MNKRIDCWCYTVQKQVLVKGEIKGKHQADLFMVTECEELGCSMKNSLHCLIGKIREGRW